MADAQIKLGSASTDVQGSVAKAANTAPPPFNIPFILTAIATGASVLSAVKAAVGATKSAAASAGASGGGASLSSPSITPASSPPAFNIVGSDPQTQLADAIGQQAQKPVKALVVAGDVSTAQSLDRNIIQESSLG